MAAGHNQSQKRKFEFTFKSVSINMPGNMVNTNQWFLFSKCQCFTCINTDQQRTDKARSFCYSNRIDLLPCHICLTKCFCQNNCDLLDMMAYCDFRHYSAK